jgi:hypothetical protein
MSGTPGIGHNRPPASAPALALVEELRVASGALRAASVALLGEAKHVPKRIADDEACGRVQDLAKKLDGLKRAIDAKRRAAKQPHYDTCRLIDGFHNRMIEPLARQRALLAQSIEGYLKAREARERKAAEKLAAIAGREAETANDPVRAATARTVADDAQARATAKPADLSRVRGEYGSLASLRRGWRFEIADLAAVDLEALRPYLGRDAIEGAIAAAIEAGVRQIAGVVIAEDRHVVIR